MRNILRLAVFASLLVTAPSIWANPLEAVVGVRATIPNDARTAAFLGTEREGSGVVIAEDGLVLTIGYLILEAISAEIVLDGGEAAPAEIVGYDSATGFGLLRPLNALDIAPMELGSSAKLAVEDEVLVASFGGPHPVSGAAVASRRDFAGYWEYLLPDAIFTSPPHRGFGGAALVDRGGRLLGIGSLIVGDAAGPESSQPGNMFVPIDALQPIFQDLLEHGRSSAPARPWLGFYLEDLRGHVIVNRIADEGPAEAAGITKDDIIVAVGDEPVSDMADLYRKLWALGSAGIEVPLTVLRSGGLQDISVTSADRYRYLKIDPSY